ncbi:hypothetical protein [Persephonella sp.]
MENEKITDYGGVFYRIENVVTYLFLLIYFFMTLTYIVIKKSNISSILFIFLEPLYPFPMLTPVYYLISFIAFILLIVFFKDTKEDIRYLKQHAKNYKGEEVSITHKIKSKKIIRFPLYESLFIPRYREHPALKKLHYYRIFLYLLILGYIAMLIPSIIVNYWEGRIFAIISLVYVYTMRIWVRGISIPIFMKLTGISLREFLKFKDTAITIEKHEIEKDKKTIKKKDTIFLFVKG